ncbi:MAG: SDR family NAD(P)-dependent oxidoreductase [Polyangiaceae bacterium]|nr:SDR family NAD(P)-dependent oxidoreductase [Polyangiaceae bacterium]
MRVAVVTGANRGIGLEIARGLAARGLAVVVASRALAAAEQAVAELAAPDRVLEPCRLDVTSAAERAALADGLRTRHGGLDVLVHNAGVSFHGFDARVARDTLATNFFGALELTRLLLPLVRPGGRIVMVSSGLAERSGWAPELAARFSDPALDLPTLTGLLERFVEDVRLRRHGEAGWPTSAYGVSKAGMNALAAVLARELASDDRHILVNAACPGWVRTRMGGPGAPRSAEEGARTPLWLALLPEGGPSGGFFRDEAPADW